jgi:hypothetical protein
MEQICSLFFSYLFFKRVKSRVDLRENFIMILNNVTLCIPLDASTLNHDHKIEKIIVKHSVPSIIFTYGAIFKIGINMCFS